MGVGTMIGAFWGSVHGNLASQMGGLGGASDRSIRGLGFLWQPDQPGGGAPRLAIPQIIRLAIPQIIRLREGMMRREGSWGYKIRSVQQITRLAT